MNNNYQNPAVLLDTRRGPGYEVDITTSAEYNTVAAVIHGTRQMLVINKHARTPYLTLLSHHTILEFLNRFWPSILLVLPKRDTASFLWGYTQAGSASRADSNIYVNHPMVRRRLTLLSEEHTPPAIEAPQLGLMFTGILLRELAQIMLAWCSEGEYDTPSMKPTSSESGNYVEEAFFGGVIGGWWKRKEVGNFAKLFKIIIAYRKGVRSTGTWEIDLPSSEAAIALIRSPSSKLPFVDVKRLNKLRRPKSVVCRHIAGNETDESDEEILSDTSESDTSEGDEEDQGPGVVFVGIGSDKKICGV